MLTLAFSSKPHCSSAAELLAQPRTFSIVLFLLQNHTFLFVCTEYHQLNYNLFIIKLQKEGNVLLFMSVNVLAAR